MFEVDLHRHDEFSSFDGFGEATKLAITAKQKGLKALGISNHGNSSALVKHYFACKEQGIKPILGVEVYFQPKFDKEKPRYHLCLFAKNLEGYNNLNKIQTEALDNFYYNPIVTFKLLKKYSKGLICSSACVGGFIPQLIANKNKKLVGKAIQKFIDIFGADFYFEVQPYKLHDAKGLQEQVNSVLLKLGHKYGVKCILTSDSHYGAKEDYSTYLKMHEIAKHDLDKIKPTYIERYMPDARELPERFLSMHPRYKHLLPQLEANMGNLVSSVDNEILELLPQKLPEFKAGANSNKLLKKAIVKGLKAQGRYTKAYIARCKEEFKVIAYHGFESYFLMVQDYVLWAKRQGIAVGPGRGSVCNCQIAFALGITDVDSLYFGLDFTRFLRYDKKKLPDIDLDFETNRRAEVIQYIINKYPGKAAQISNYGLYKVDNLLNDLCKVCGVEQDKAEIKKYVSKRVVNDEFDYEEVSREQQCKIYNKMYDNIILHFSKLYRQIRFIGTHAAGVAVAGDDLQKYTGLIRRGNKNQGYSYSTAYDLNDLEKINVVKFDTLGLRTLSIIKELEKLTGDKFSYDWLEDKEVYEYFRQGRTDGIFQFEKKAAKEILKTIDADCFSDVTAASALNRPGPLSLHMHEQYKDHKQNENYVEEIWGKYTNHTYGTIIYQEQILNISKHIGQMEPQEADKILKFMKGGNSEGLASSVEGRKREEKHLRKLFVKGAMRSGMSKQDALELFEKITVYSFNQGHAVGYTLISLIQMYYKVKYPEYFWYVSLKFAANDDDLIRLKIEAVREGNVILLPHVNYGAEYKLVTMDGEEVLAEGLCNVKNVGVKAAQTIEAERRENGVFTSYDNFVERVPKRQVNARVVNSLLESGALEFNKKTYLKRVTKYNSQLYTKGMRKNV